VASTDPTQVSADMTVHARAPRIALILGAISLFGLVFPPLLGAGVAGIVLSRMALRRIASGGGALKGRTTAWIALALSVVGSLLSLVLPLFVVYVWIYAASHGGRIPFN
jgi:hypothetical protein